MTQEWIVTATAVAALALAAVALVGAARVSQRQAATARELAETRTELADLRRRAADAPRPETTAAVRTVASVGPVRTEPIRRPRPPSGSEPVAHHGSSSGGESSDRSHSGGRSSGGRLSGGQSGAGRLVDDGVPRVDGRLFADLLLRETVVTAAGLVYGVRRALRPEMRNLMRFEAGREVKRARRRRRADLRDARRDVRQRQRGVRSADDAAAARAEDDAA